MDKIGIPEVRKYCSPLQALFWLAEDNELGEYDKLISEYSLRRLLGKAWKFDPLAYRLISDEQIRSVVDGIEDEALKKQYLYDLQHNYTSSQLQKSLVSDYEISQRNHKQIFSKKSARIIEENLLNPRGSHRWENYKRTIDRLNSPELFDMYINRNIYYKFTIPAYNRPPRTIIKSGYGDCDDLANFGRIVLSRAGYDVFGRLVGPEDRLPNHVGLGIKLEDGTYLLAVNFDRGRNHMGGPFSTILELDKALGYGFYAKRGPYYFNKTTPPH
jgi:hypothetical protein